MRGSGMRLDVIVAPPVEPVTVDEVRLHIRMEDVVTPTTDPADGLLASLIAAAREYVERYTRRALVQQTLRMTLPRFPVARSFFGQRWDDDDFETRAMGIELPRPPAISVSAVRYYDETNTLQTLATSAYYLDASGSQPASLEPASDAAWPSTYCRRDAVQIEYIAGYAPIGSPADYRAGIPESIKTALKFHVQQHFDGVDQTAVIEGLLQPFKIYTF